MKQASDIIVSELTLEFLLQWLGNERRDDDIAHVRQANLMAATIRHPAPALVQGDVLPPLWHWIYFHEMPVAAAHGPLSPAETFLPPIDWGERLWAGGRVLFDAPVWLGEPIHKHSRILNIEQKAGKSGSLVFVTVQHDIYSRGQCAIQEERRIVYRRPLPGRPAAADPPGATTLRHRKSWNPDQAQLFHYSSLTFNSNPVHYCPDYCRLAGRDGRVMVHGPLAATMLAQFAGDVGNAALRSFDYRMLQPLRLGEPVGLAGDIDGQSGRFHALTPGGHIAVDAAIRF